MGRKRIHPIKPPLQPLAENSSLTAEEQKIIAKKNRNGDGSTTGDADNSVDYKILVDNSMKKKSQAYAANTILELLKSNESGILNHLDNSIVAAIARIPA